VEEIGGVSEDWILV